MRRLAGGQRGIALLMVLGLIALMTAVVAEFMEQSSIDMRLSLNARDELQAELNALSALRMRALILKQQTQLRQLLSGPLAGLAGGAAPAAAASADAAAAGAPAPSLPLGPILEQIPVTCGLLSQIASRVERGALPGEARTGGDGRARGGAAEVGDFFPGECDATSRSEHGKIAINLLLNKVEKNRERVAKQLLEMFSNRILRPLFEEDDRSGGHADSPQALVGHLLDWIDPDHTEEGTFGDEDRYYQYLRDPYRAKNAPFDSVAEIKLVHGVNDVIFSLLENNVSVVTSTAKIELGTANPQLIVLGLLSAAKDGIPAEQTLQAAGLVLAKVQQTKATWGSPTLSAIRAVLASAGAAALFDDKTLGETFSESDGSTWYTIEATGEVGQARRTIKAVFQTGEGSFYYARLD